MRCSYRRSNRVLRGSSLLAVALSAAFTLTSPAGAQPSPEAKAKAEAEADAAAPVPFTGEAAELVDAIESATDNAKRSEHAERLAVIAHRHVPVLRAALDRPRESTDEQRRAVLEAIRAAVPDEKGRFRTPARQRADQVRADDEFDWLGELVQLDPAMAGLGEVFADIAILRALAASKDVDGGTAILDFAFDDIGIIYRDECGRYLRKMAPYSVPALIVGTNQRGSLHRYALYQLERIDREQPFKALAAVDDNEALKVAVLDAYRETKDRSAVHAVLEVTNDTSRRVRKAARETWMSYFTGPPPPPAPKKRLELPGGKLAKEETPLWLTYRELADVEIRRVHEEVFGEKPPRKATSIELSEKLFAHYDAAREARRAQQYEAAKQLAAAGKLEEAVEAFDIILASDPDFEHRAELVPLYLEHAKDLEEAERWQEASDTYSKAHGLEPEGEHADDALAGHHYAMGKALAAEGKDGSAAFRKATEIQPGHRSEAGGGASWMLYAGIGGGAGALALLIFGLVRRR